MSSTISQDSASAPDLAALVQHIGIAEGQMRVGAYDCAQRCTYGAISDVVNLASRLMTAAPAGEILCDDRIYRLARERITFESLAPIRVKGKAEPVRVYRPTPQTTRRRAVTSEIVGRRTELAEIQRLLDVVQTGASRILVIEGEAGIG